MILLKPIADERVWGGEKLKPLVNEDHLRIGHLYSCIDNNDMVSPILNGEYKGQNLNDYFKINKKRLGLNSFNRFPIVLALVDARENLSIQVHPDDEMITRLENESWGKNESWYFLEAPLDGHIINGCKCKDKTKLRELFEKGDYCKAVSTVEVKKGDYLYCEAGTLHALTAGCLTYEIEENRDYTYRFYDYGRLDSSGNPRKMQMEKALCSLNVNQKSIATPVQNGTFDHRGYSFKMVTSVNNYQNNSSTIQLISLIEGLCTIDNIAFKPGMTAILEPGESLKGDLRQFMIVEPKNL